MPAWMRRGLPSMQAASGGAVAAAALRAHVQQPANRARARQAACASGAAPVPVASPTCIAVVGRRMSYRSLASTSPAQARGGEEQARVTVAVGEPPPPPPPGEVSTHSALPLAPLLTVPLPLCAPCVLCCCRRG